MQAYSTCIEITVPVFFYNAGTVLKKIVINQGLGMAVADKEIIEVAINEMTAITGQKAVATISRKDIANFRLRKKMPIGVIVPFAS